MTEAITDALLPVYSKIAYPISLVRGEGVYVTDTDGNTYIDFYGGHCVCCLGHSPTEVIDAITAQSRTLMFYSNLAPIPIRERAAKRLITYAANGMSKVFFCNSGAEANENALKIAVKATGRKKIVAYKGAFHGRTILAMNATDAPAWHETFDKWIGRVARITANDTEGLSAIDEETAAVILEPIQSIGGCTVFEKDYLLKVREACDKTGAMLIFDEVQTGMGRTGVPFVSGHCGVLPEMMTLAKGLAAGFPIGAVVMTQGTADKIEPGDIAATFGGGPMAMAAMEATIESLERYNLAEHCQKIEAYVREKFQIEQVKKIVGRGCLLGLILDRDAKPVREALFAQGIIAGLNSNPKLLHLLPPLTILERHVDELFEALLTVLAVRPEDVEV